MNSYLDINLQPDTEMPWNWLMNTVYTKLHKTLFDLKSNSIAVSFPDYKLTLGTVLRLHGNEDDLRVLQQHNWLGGMSGYCRAGEIAPVPESVAYRNIRRMQSKMTQAKLNRLIKRGSITEAETKHYRAMMFTKSLDNPYVELTSASNGHKYRRYIELGPLLDKPIAGEFDQFGLSKTATVPWF